MRPLNESTVVITGATSGLGRHLAGELVTAGARVVVHGHSASRLAEVQAELGTVDTVLADLASLSEVDRLASELSARYDRVDVLVNNAGIGFGPPGAPAT